MLVGKVEGCFNEVLSGYHGYLKEIQRVFEEKKISKKSFMCASRMFQ